MKTSRRPAQSLVETGQTKIDAGRHCDFGVGSWTGFEECLTPRWSSWGGHGLRRWRRNCYIHRGEHAVIAARVGGARQRGEVSR